jgi:F420-non-reducing hydrogenase iron-sulfur subunit
MERPPNPVVVGFLCTWCAYRAADLVGTTRRPYSSGFRPVRVVCSGRVGPELVLRALAAGADGVLVVGCRPGECHRVDGNLKALRRVTLLRRALDQVGVDRERVQLVWTAASEGAVLAEAADAMAETVRRLGPLARRDHIFGAMCPESDPGPWEGA